MIQTQPVAKDNMPIARLGYACINSILSNDGVSNSRGMIKKTFTQKGPDYASELALQNSRDILKILQWNDKHGIKLFRISSNIFPWSSEFDITKNKLWPKIAEALLDAGEFARAHGHRVTMHPGQFNCLASPSSKVIDNSIVDLEIHGLIMETMGFDESPFSKINIHLGGAYGDPDQAMKTFNQNFQRLSQRVRSRLTVENDDKKNMFSTSMLVRGVHEVIGIPIVFDWHHYDLGPVDIEKSAALTLAATTWPAGINPVCHHSSPKKIHEDLSIKSMTSHADFLYSEFLSGDNTIDLMLECKAKEQALLKYRADYL
jgi:UV DNA damage endonuclease